MKTRKKFDPFPTIYSCQIFLRLFLVILPQTGYIHPDELFQSVEVLAGKVLEFQCSPPWEFNVTFPIRSMTIPCLTTGVSYKFLKFFNYVSLEYFHQTLLTPYALILVPRLLMCLLSFLVDFSLFKICSNNNEKYKSRLVILGSSYVMIVYGTRTFSNTIELVLFSLLLYFVCESLIFSNVVIRNREYINYRYEQSKDIAEKAKFHKLRLFIVSDSYRNCFFISIISVLGFFNRPTFLAFAVMPIFFWLYRGLGSKSVTPFQFYMRILIFAMVSIPTFLTVILIDSFYYGYITWGEIGMLDVSINSFVFTPLNFLKYNLNTDNLAKHGLHPRCLHVLVNIPLLFNVLGLYALYTLAKYAYICFLKKFNLLPSVRSVKCLMTLSFLVPVILLSIFPHQEPRFLIPVLVPLVYLHATRVLPETDTSLVEAPKVHIKGELKKTKPSNVLFKLWLLINTLLVIFYGFLHQGGIYPATAYLSKELQSAPLKTEFHILTSHVYSLPESFFMQKSIGRLYSKGRIQYSVSRRVFLYEEGSKKVELILKKLQLILESRQKNLSKKGKVYFLISSSLDDKLENLSVGSKVRFYLVERFTPHISTEAFPDMTAYCLDLFQSFYGSHCTGLTLVEYLKWLYNSFGLSLYQAELKDVKKVVI
ncbi:unnamed protein product [Phaedon cochleariae]|uniref:Mannosyltransferase n=1 Tax=Phaedon cochleariae TaxID=80249 RepID=A0A9N9WYC3_PHACE|nr:unnamed protein product [Phaedon cochleariae]